MAEPERLQVDYSTWPTLEGAPPSGATIAFKVLEVSARWMPEVSDWKVATVLAVRGAVVA